MLIFNALMALFAALLAIPVIWFSIQIAAACCTRGGLRLNETPRSVVADSPRIAVLIPAHNESVNLTPTLRSVQQQGLANLRVVVVADNCGDDTAAVARQEGAEVVERTNPLLRGKGYALDFGVKHLQHNPPDVVVILDADCLLEHDVLQSLGMLALTTMRPAQALYLMKNPDGSASIKSKIAEFAWLVKNHVRPRGLHTLGLPCQLTGSGMAFPWTVLNRVPLATGEIVEDMKLGMALATLGHPPIFLETAVVTSTFPADVEGIQSQRRRWEHGHLSMLLKEGIPKLFKGLFTRDFPLFFLALDLCIPPLALLVVLTCVWLLIASMFWAWSGNSQPFIVGVTCLLLTGTAVVAAWHQFGRHVVSGRELLMAPVYVLSKLSVYIGFLFRRQSEWVRSKRDHERK